MVEYMDMFDTIYERLRNRRRAGIADFVYVVKNPNDYHIYAFIPKTFRFAKFTLESVMYYVMRQIITDSLVASVYITNIDTIPENIEKPPLHSSYFAVVFKIDDDVSVGDGIPHASESDLQRRIFESVNVSFIHDFYIEMVKEVI